MLSGRGLCDELITRPETSYRLWCVVVCDLETSRIGAPSIYDISSLRVKHVIRVKGLTWHQNINITYCTTADLGQFSRYSYSAIGWTTEDLL